MRWVVSILVGCLLTGLIVCLIQFRPTYRYHGIADSSEQIELVMEAKRYLGSDDFDVSFKTPDSNKMFYHFQSREEVVGLEYIEYKDWTNLVLVLLGWIVAFMVWIFMGDS